jgi:type I restriction enzyme R subunit
MKEAKARIKINKFLEEAGWRLLDDAQGKANVVFENNVKITQHQLDEMGEDFETQSNGFVDFLLLDANGFPLVVLEAKAEDKKPTHRKRTGAQVRACAALPFRAAFERESTFLLGSQTGQPAGDRTFSDSGNDRWIQGVHPEPGCLDQRGRRQRLRRPDSATGISKRAGLER